MSQDTNRAPTPADSEAANGTDVADDLDDAGVTDEAEPTDEQVAGFLRGNPSFLADNPDLLSELTPPSRWSDNAVVDMQKAMVDILREEMAGLRACTQEVIETSRSNMNNQTRTHQAILAMVAAEDVDRLAHIVVDDLPLLLDVDVAVLAFEPGHRPSCSDVEIRALDDGDVDDLIGAGQDALLVDQILDGGDVFGGGAGLVRSAAFVRLRPGEQVPAGLLALGCRHEGAFHQQQGTELLRFLAQILELCLQRLSPRPT